MAVGAVLLTGLCVRLRASMGGLHCTAASVSHAHSTAIDPHGSASGARRVKQLCFLKIASACDSVDRRHSERKDPLIITITVCA